MARSGHAVPARIHALLLRWLPGASLEVQRAGSGGSTEVYRVQRGSDVMWLRLAEDPGEDRSVEYVVHERLRATGARVPAILMAEAAPPELDRSAALTSHTPGVPLIECADPAVAERVAFAAGEDLARINALPVRGYGWIDRIDADGAVVAEHERRQEWVREYRNAARTVVERRLLPEHLLDGFAAVMAEWCGWGAHLEDGYLVTESRLAHGDFDTTHIYHDPDTGAYTGIIDFGEGRGAEFEYDLGHLLLHDGQGGRPRIYSAVSAAWAPMEGRQNSRALFIATAIATRQIPRMLDRGNHAYAAFLAERAGDFVARITGMARPTRGSHA